MKITEKIDLCVYHSPCTDGWGAAWAVHDKFPGAELVPATYHEGRDEEDKWVKLVGGRNVVVVDFTFPRELTEKLYAAANYFRVIDHHGPTMSKFEGLDYCYFDVTKSGAVLAWEACHEEPVPTILKYVQDQDLWRWELENSKLITAVINTADRSVKAWKGLEGRLSYPQGIADVVSSGAAMKAYEDSIINEVLPNAREWTIAGRKCLAVNSPWLRSQIAGELAKGCSFGACFWIGDGTVTWSLRVRGDSKFDVAELAKNFGNGGGHSAAAGFTVPVTEVDFVNRVV